MNPQSKLVEEQSAEADFIDDIAELLPTEQRPLWYRDMAHLRRLPADDEMLRIARAMGFLALVTRQTPAQIATEREKLATILDHSIKAIQSARQDAVALHQQLEERLAQLPAEISEGISPAAIAAKLGESLRQQFVASGIPETAQALAVISKQTKQVAGEFDRSSKQLTDSYRGAASDARRALDQNEQNRNCHVAVRVFLRPRGSCAARRSKALHRPHDEIVLPWAACDRAISRRRTLRRG